MRLDHWFAQRRRGAEMSRRAAGKFPRARLPLGAVGCIDIGAAPLTHPLCASAPLRDQKSKLSYSNMFTLCSPRIGGQAHGA